MAASTSRPAGSIPVAADAPGRPALRYHGGKWRLTPWTLSHLPAAHDTYVTGFGGSLSDLLRKARSLIEVANDLDGDVMTYFRVLRERPEELIRQIRLTPFHVGEYRQAQEPTDDPMERARRFYIRSYMAIAGPTAQANSGWRRQKVFSRGRDGRKMMTPAAVTFFNVDHLYDVAARLTGVTFEQSPALELIDRYDNPRTLFYLDPPYHPETRSWWATTTYRHEMSHEDHVELLAAVNRVRGMAAVAGYRCALYDEALAHWTRHDKVSRTNGDGSAVESLWVNPAAVAALEQAREREHLSRRPQLSFFNPDGSTRFRDEEE